MIGDWKAFSGLTSSSSITSCFTITLVISISCEIGDFCEGNRSKSIEKATSGSSRGSSFTPRGLIGSGAFPLSPFSSCIFSTSTNLCFCHNILVSASICLSFSCSNLSLSTLSTGAVLVVAGTPEDTEERL